MLPHLFYIIATAPVQQLLCFPNGDDCFSGSTNLTLTTYEACCQPLLVDSTTRRSFMSGGHCFECIGKNTAYKTMLSCYFLHSAVYLHRSIASSVSIINLKFSTHTQAVLMLKQHDTKWWPCVRMHFCRNN